MPQQFPPQTQSIPGHQEAMKPEPLVINQAYQGSGKLSGRVALISGGDSGIGRSVAALFAREGADVAIVYLNEHDDAEVTRTYVEKEGRRFLAIAGDIGDEAFCRRAVDQVIETFGSLTVLVNNAAEQHPVESLEDITSQQLEATFRTNVFGMFYLSKAALPHLQRGASIINTTSVTAYRGSPGLLDYSATKGAIVAFTRSLALSLAEKGIRVNAVAPGPIWTPLIVSTFTEDKIASFGSDTPMKRAGQPAEVATNFVFLASDDASYITGQVMHPNGGEVVNT